MNNWINHCKEYCKIHNVTYRQALKDAKETYLQQKGNGLEASCNPQLNVEEQSPVK